MFLQKEAKNPNCDWVIPNSLVRPCNSHTEKHNNQCYQVKFNIH